MFPNSSILHSSSYHFPLLLLWSHHTFHSMAMQLPPATLYAGKPSVLLPPTSSKSSFLPYYSMRLLRNKKPLTKSSSSAPRFSMRVSSKQAYICRDCGSLNPNLYLSSSLYLLAYKVYLSSYHLCLDFLGIFTMIEHHSTSYLITTFVQVWWFLFVIKPQFHGIVF